MNFEFDNNIPIYIQLVDQLKIYIISGRLKPGDKILSVRELAFQTKVNPNTMQKALVELEELGLIYTERTNGKYVTTDIELIEEYKKEYAKKISQKFLFNMKNIGFSNKDAIKYLENLKGEKE